MKYPGFLLIIFTSLAILCNHKHEENNDNIGQVAVPTSSLFAQELVSDLLEPLYNVHGTCQTSVALSADGYTLAVGTPTYNNNSGAVHIFTRNDSSPWAYQTTLSQGAPYAYEGTSVALSAQGGILVAGAPNYNDGQGKPFMYVASRDKNMWVPIMLKAASDKAPNKNLEGSSVSLSASGDILAAGAPKYNEGQGGVFIYKHAGNSWQIIQTLSQGGIGMPTEGSSVSISSTNNILATGAPTYQASGTGFTHGAAHLYYFNESTQRYDFHKTLTQTQKSSVEGTSVALDADGVTFASGASDFNKTTGAVQIYTFDNNTKQWNHKQRVAYPANSSQEGRSVALSANGQRLAAGAPLYNFSQGVTQIYTYLGSSWENQATLTCDKRGSGEGMAVALSSNGNVLVVGYCNRHDTVPTYVWSQDVNEWLSYEMPLPPDA